MKAIIQDTYGSPEIMKLGEIAKPEVGADDVLLRVKAAGVDRGVWHLMAGRPYLIRIMGYGLRAPKNPVPGMDVAGVVEAVGVNTRRFKPGDEVFGICDGSFAEFVTTGEDRLAAKPANLSFAEAAIVPVSACTALEGLRDVGGIQAGQKVMIIGASGGVGSYALQLAKEFGGQVTGVCSTAKMDLVRSLGADEVVDYTRDDLGNQVNHYDLILDIAGNRPLRQLRRFLKPKGTLVIVGGEEGGPILGGVDRLLRGALVSPFVGQKIRGFVCAERQADLETLRVHIEAGRIIPTLEKTFPLGQAADAVRHMVAGKARGKVALTI